MVVTLASGRVVKLVFCHSSANGVTPEDAGELRRNLDETARLLNRRVSYTEVVDVTDKDNPNILSSGLAVCHENDTFSRFKGRKHSTTKAMKSSTLSYGERTEVWDAFNKEFGVQG